MTQRCRDNYVGTGLLLTQIAEMDNSEMSVGKNLAYQRQANGMSQGLLAEKSGVTIRTIQRIEKGEVNPQLQTIKLLADALEIGVDEIAVLENPSEEKVHSKWLLFLHGSPLLGFIFPFSILFPLFIWIHKREDNHIYNKHGVRIINFQLNMTIIYILAMISLVTVEKWGFIFFILAVPFNFVIVTLNVFTSTLHRKAFYPVAIPFLKMNKSSFTMKTLLMLFPFMTFLLACSSSETNSSYENYLQYEGTYEYTGNTTLEIIVSDLDTSLYAVVDKAKYPLEYVSVDTFSNVQGTHVIFSKDDMGQISGYSVNGEAFKLINREVEKQTMFPRKELFGKSEEYEYKTPVKVDDGLQTGKIDEEFKNPASLIKMIEETIKGNYPDVHSILVFKNNKLVLEEYFYDYDKDTPHQLRSATKPFIGAIMGIAVDKGYIASEQDKIFDYFKSVYPDIPLDDKKRDITIEDFLRYRHGLDCENDNPESAGNETTMMQSEDWVKHTLELPVVTEPGKVTSYCSGCSLTIGNLTEIATDTAIEDFAKKYFFDPLEITNYKWRFDADKTSSTTFSQMYLTPRDLVRIGKMYQQGGVWNGKQVLSKEWVDKTFEMEKGHYGYFWKERSFQVNDKTYSSYMATGNGGQKVNIWPELDMITVFTGGNYNSYFLYGKSTPPNEMIPKYILNALINAGE